MSSPSSKMSTAKVLKNIKVYVNKHPEAGPAILMSVQNGDFELKKKETTDIIPDYKQLARLSSDDKQELMEGWLPLTASMWEKVKRAVGKEGSKFIVHQCFYRLACESPMSELPTRSKALLKKIYTAKRATFVKPQKLQFNADFTLNWKKNGIFELGDIVKRNSEDVYTTVKHRAYDVKVNLPKNITAPISQAEILDNWDEKGARVTTTSRDFEKLIYDVMKDELADYQLKVLLKKAEWKKQLDQARKAASGASDGAVATGTGSSTDATPKPTGKRGLKRNLSELSVPEELRAPAKK